VARSYAAVRPQYPDALYAYLASLAPGRDLAWDVATGNGQAAVGLARHVQRVIATDASAAQIAAAMIHPRIEYHVARAEESQLGARTADLITVAQAVHWFELPAFYREVEHVARRDAVLAVWSYGYFAMTPEIDEIIERFAEGKLVAYWPEASRVIRDHYRTLAFPFAEIDVPRFTMEHQFTLAELELYFRSWSGVQRYIDATGDDPVPVVIEEIAGVWGERQIDRTARFELYLRAGRVSPN
jgi:ubiquinone/menaquinone biosynthesis C-methylase UbiE